MIHQEALDGMVHEIFLSKIACKKLPSPAEGSKNVADTFSHASLIPGVSSIFWTIQDGVKTSPCFCTRCFDFIKFSSKFYSLKPFILFLLYHVSINTFTFIRVWHDKRTKKKVTINFWKVREAGTKVTKSNFFKSYW